MTITVVSRHATHMGLMPGTLWPRRLSLTCGTHLRVLPLSEVGGTAVRSGSVPHIEDRAPRMVVEVPSRRERMNRGSSSRTGSQLARTSKYRLYGDDNHADERGATCAWMTITEAMAG